MALTLFVGHRGAEVQTGPGCRRTHLHLVCCCGHCWFHGRFSSKRTVVGGFCAHLPSSEDASVLGLRSL